MKKDNIGKKCILKTLHNNIYTTSHGGFPCEKDYLPFVILGVFKGGYFIYFSYAEWDGSFGGQFKVKTKDIIIID